MNQLTSTLESIDARDLVAVTGGCKRCKRCCHVSNVNNFIAAPAPAAPPPSPSVGSSISTSVSFNGVVA